MSQSGKQKRFKYRLESVLKAREAKKKQQQATLSKAQRIQAEEQRKEEEIKKFQAEKYMELRTELSAGETVDFNSLILRKTHLERLAKAVDEQIETREKADAVVQTEQEKLTYCTQAEKIIKKDKENRRTLWKRAVQREEIKTIDDIASGQFVRKQQDQFIDETD